MELNTLTIIFIGLSLLMVAAALLAVTTRNIMRATTYLLFVLFGTAGLYFILHYTFLGAVQVTVYAGGIIVLLSLPHCSSVKVRATLRTPLYCDTLPALRLQ